MKRWSIAIIGAVAMALSYELNIYIVPFVILAGLFIVFDASKEKFPFWLSVPTVVFVLIHSRWLLSLIQWEGWISGVVVFVLALLYGFLWIMAALYLLWRVRQNRLSPIWRGLIIVVVEWLMTLGLFGYPLFSIYYTQAYSPFVRLSVCPIIGAGLISFGVVLVSSILANFIQGKGNRVHLGFAIFFSLWFMVASSGHIWRAAPAALRQLDVVVAQPNLAEKEKLNMANHASHLDYYVSLIRKIQETELDWDVLVLPESLIGDLWEDVISERFRSLGLSPSQLLIFGQPIERGDDVYNAVCFFQNGAVQKIYLKHKLVPYSEAMPPLFNFLAKAHVHYFSSGPEPRPIKIKGVRYGTTVCFESMFSEIYSRLKDSDILIVATNDAWFDRHFQELHLRSAIFRAAELRKPLLLANNTGISAVITAEGHIEQWLSSGKAGYLRANLHF